MATVVCRKLFCFRHLVISWYPSVRTTVEHAYLRENVRAFVQSRPQSQSFLEKRDGDPNRKTDTIRALDMEDHLSANMQAAEESRLVLGAE